MWRLQRQIMPNGPRGRGRACKRRNRRPYPPGFSRSSSRKFTCQKSSALEGYASASRWSQSCATCSSKTSSHLSGGPTSLSVAVKVTVALNFYAGGSFQATSTYIANISQFAVHCCIRDALYSRRRNYISWSMSTEKQQEHTCRFARIAGIPMVQGAIDCTHVALRAPHHNTMVFCNSKDYHSQNIQLACEYRQRFLAVNARYPGRTNDSFILRQVTVPGFFNLPHGARGWLLRYKGYILATWLMTPFHNPNTRAQHSYNESHAATRNCIKQTIGVLKQRYRCLDHSGGALQYSPDRVSLFVVVCCLLHNLPIERAQPLRPKKAGPPQEEDEEEEAEDNIRT
uniref:putative nuclease HARBI1 n=1 Tax=Pristiophorus japonicus TaxID=55135 RepID=UPI00398F3F7A